ncbi:MAG: NAD(P)H-hydrate dehydratase [Lachnospiraceae bacterium]|nr:NAD(P)H-hydrate dehydratase [Lachnospiraceae bacterium]
MKRILTSQEMANCDKYTIEEMGVPSLVLMERAALAVTDLIKSHFDKKSLICALCGPGNNGGDGVAIARILHLQGYNVFIHMLGDESKYSHQLKEEIRIANKYNVPFNIDINSITAADLVIDAIFGIGLSRDISGTYFDAIQLINENSCNVVSVDIPSGYDSDTGKVLGIGVKADYTVTFAYEKSGLLLGDCYLNRGELTIADVGIYIPDNNDYTPCYELDDFDIYELLPPLKRSDNKGTRGKVLVIAGSENIYGACYLSAKAALTCGSGLVKIYTHKNNIGTIQSSLPEAMYLGYDAYNESELEGLLDWADAIVIGPGLSTSELAHKIVAKTLTYAKSSIIIDADAINIIAEDTSILRDSVAQIVLTPHLKEMSRLCGEKVDDIQANMRKNATAFCGVFGCSIILKSFTSYIVTPNAEYINTAGNEGMATAGSGDILSGVLGSLLGCGMSMDCAPAVASYIHGTAGVKAGKSKGKRQVIASDIINAISL